MRLLLYCGGEPCLEIRDGFGPNFFTWVGSSQPSVGQKNVLKKLIFFNLLSCRVKKSWQNGVKKYSGQSPVSPLFTEGQIKAHHYWV